MLPCVDVVGFGFSITVSLPEWSEQYIQDDETTIEIADRMSESYPWEYPWNEDQPPSYYMEFSISNLDEFRSQLEAFKNA